MGNHRVKFILRVLIAVVIFSQLAMGLVFLLHEVFDFTSSNTAVYFLRGKDRAIEVSRDLLFEDSDRLIFMLDANCLFNLFMKELAIARHKPLLELTWNRKEGRGEIKQFRSDGTMVVLSFSRFLEDRRRTHGLFLGGNLPYGDVSASKDYSTSGFGYYDGSRWSHIWCNANEGFGLAGIEKMATPSMWKYLGSRVIKETEEEIILESEHEADFGGNRIGMKRVAFFGAGQDYFILKVSYKNHGKDTVVYRYAYGDEPWVGSFGASTGDVGWYGGGLIKYESFISPGDYRYAGYWDFGNDAAGEEHHYTGHANFIEWLSPLPSHVFFSNSLYCCSPNTPLYAAFNRVINILWFNQTLMPGASSDHLLAIGMARPDPDTGLPVKPEVKIN